MDYHLSDFLVEKNSRIGLNSKKISRVRRAVTSNTKNSSDRLCIFFVNLQWVIPFMIDYHNR